MTSFVPRPKSVSILAVCLNDNRLVVAHEKAAQVALRELETFASTRIRKSNQHKDRSTGNLIGAQFTHTTSRALDPQLHTHFTVFNATRYATEVYRNELARRVRALGYRTKRAEIAWEIEGVTEEIRERFSKRSAVRDVLVGEIQQRLGRKLTHNQVSNVVHWSREKKVRGISAAEVRARHEAELSSDELQVLRDLRLSAAGPVIGPRTTDEREILNFAVAHAFERRSVVPEHDLLAFALAHRPGEVELSKLREAVRESPGLIATPQGYSTAKILETELSLISAVEKGKSAVAPLHTDFRPADWLSADQKSALAQVLQSEDRITGFCGLAGTGKTTVLKQLNGACTEAGYSIQFCAPNVGATDVLKKEGLPAITLEWLLRQSDRTTPKNRIIVLDEAGAVSVNDMARLLALDSRAILSGEWIIKPSIAPHPVHVTWAPVGDCYGAPRCHHFPPVRPGSESIFFLALELARKCPSPTTSTSTTYVQITVAPPSVENRPPARD